MSNEKTIEVRIDRTLPASAAEAFDAWLNPAVPGTPWQLADKLLFNPTVDGFFYWAIKGTPHYGRFTTLERSALIQHTWMSPNTSGLESTVTVTFKEDAKGTRMTLMHSGLPDTSGGRSHETGWNFFLDGFHRQLTTSATTHGEQ